MSPVRSLWDRASRGPLDPVARQALDAAVDAGWADPTRLYAEARQARMLLDAARESIAAAIGARADEISFTPSTAQARHRALAGLMYPALAPQARVVVSAVEHSAILRCAGALDRPTTFVEVDTSGRVDVDRFVEACTQPTAAACLQAANQEVGTLQPLAEVAAALATRGIPVVCDASPALGHVVVPSGWAVLTAAPDSFGGPSGIGILAVRTGVRWTSPALPDEPVSVPLATAAAIALEQCRNAAELQSARLHSLVDRIRSRVPELITDAFAVGDPTRRLPHVLTLTCMYVDGEVLVTELDRHGFAVTSGSACVSEDEQPSHVLAAMGAMTHGNIRISLPWDVSSEEVDRFLTVLPGIVETAREHLS